jgi:hypothetical protein
VPSPTGQNIHRKTYKGKITHGEAGEKIGETKIEKTQEGRSKKIKADEGASTKKKLQANRNKVATTGAASTGRRPIQRGDGRPGEQPRC